MMKQQPTPVLAALQRSVEQSSNNRFRTYFSRVLVIVVVLSIAGSLPVPSAGHQGPPQQGQQPAASGLVEYKDFHSEKMGRDVRYALQLPPSYATSKKRYPVMIFLLGLFENVTHWDQRGGAAAADKLRSDGKIGEMIIVSIAAENGLYTDSADGKAPWEQMLTYELPKYIDATYRTMPGVAHHAIGGISLGGYGALKIAFRHPDAFGVVITHCAAILPAFPPKPSQSNGRPSFYTLFASVFGDPYNQEMWDNNDPIVLAKRDAAQIKKSGIKIYFDCGTEDRFQFFNGAKTLDETLTSLQIPHEFHLFPGNHGLGIHSQGNGSFISVCLAGH